MSTLATAKFNSDSEDDENDQEFVPSELKSKPKKQKTKIAGSKRKRPASGPSGDENDGEGSSSAGSDSDDSENEDDHPVVDKEELEEIERLRTEAAEAEDIARKEKAKNLFAMMQAEATDPLSGGASGSKPVEGQGAGAGKQMEMVEVKRARRFAGETIYETVLLPRSDPEAIAYLTKSASTTYTNSSQPSQSTIPAPGTGPLEMKNPSSENPAVTENPIAGPSNPTIVPPPSASVSASKPKPGPRKKPRQSLEALAASLDKGKKMTTLEKSQMDWKSHLSTSNTERDEIEKHRKSGGYLEKRDFLDRVDDRRTESYEKIKKGR